MNNTPRLASGRDQAARPPGHLGPAQVGRRPCNLAALRRVVATWGERIRFRRQLEHKLKCAPHLIDDMGLTKRQAEAEIAKRFWQR